MGHNANTKNVLTESISLRDATVAIKPFLELVDTIIEVSRAIFEAHRKSQYNKKTCGILLTRVEFAECAVKSLIRHKEDHVEDFHSQDYYQSFAKFAYVIKKIQKFVEDISQLSQFKRFTNSQSIKNMLLTILEDFDTCSSELKLRTFVNTEKDMKILDSDLEQMKFLENPNICVTELNENGNQEYCEKFMISLSAVQEHVKITNSEIDRRKEGQTFQINQIPFEELEIPNGVEVKHGSVIKRRYRGIDVACKKVNIMKDEAQAKRFKTRVTILGKLHLCESIIRFYGMSKSGSNDYMIYEWAERHSLKEVYENHKLSLCKKVSIALDICQGLVFLNAIGIYHHDIRCENILMTTKWKPKIANFTFAKGVKGVTSEINHQGSLNWMAPEMMVKYRYKNLHTKYPYTPGCEIFSFGMLLWELRYERIPYKEKEIIELMDHVTSGKREKLMSSCEDEQKYAKIIRKAWEHDPDLRIELASLLDEIQKLNAC
ncbi:9960_t:CDS:2, partial [Acaulospora morrowiae]